MVYRLFLSAVVLLFFTQCAVYEPSYAEPEEERLKPEDLPSEEAFYTLYLVGDAGKGTDINKKTLSLLSEQLDTAKGRDAVIFLGDNVYPSGMPDSTHKDREQSEKYLKAQIDAVKPYESDVVFVAGNHDWKLGLASVKREAKFIKDHLKDQASFLPDPGCGGPVIKGIREGLVFLMLDSQWWMEEWDEHEYINIGCKVTNRDQYLDELEDIFKRYQDKTIIVAMHHPVYTFGSHGGQFAFNAIFFPLRDLNPNLYIPIPFIGSTLRANAGIRQDDAYPPFVAFKKAILERSKGYNNIIFAAGHEHNLQYIYENGHPFIVSGAAAKQTAGRAGGPAKYTSGQGGFAALKFYDDGSIYALFYNATSRKIDYIAQVRAPHDATFSFNFEKYKELGDSTTATLLDEDDALSKYKHLAWGNLHKEKYYTPVKAKVMDINTMEGGLSLLHESGDSRTPALGFRDLNYRDYTLKSLKRNANFDEGSYRGTRFEDVLNDVYSFTHPFAPFIIPPMANELQIYHTDPQLVYLPRQPGLSIYNKEFGDDLYIFEKAPDNNPIVIEAFGKIDGISTTFEMLQKNEAGNNYHVDRSHYLRNRIFDMLIGDWNRKELNWYWAEFNTDTSDVVLVRPIPHNRQQAFSSFDGIFPQLANKSSPNLRQFQSFGDKIPRIRWYNSYGRFLDKRLLAGLSWEDWEKEVKLVQENLTDSIIEHSVRQLPKPIFDIDGQEIIDGLKARRDGMLETAREYYLLISEHVEIVGTDRPDKFEFTRLLNGNTQVKVSTMEEDSTYSVRFQHTFKENITEEIHAYGLSGNDVFLLRGLSNDGIKVRVIGGQGDDVTRDSSKVNDLVRKTLAYDRKDGMTIIPSSETVDKRSGQYNENNYNFKEDDRNYLLLWPIASYNSDHGFSIGGVLNYRLHTFKRMPYAQDHRVMATYSTSNHAALLTYEGIFNESIGEFDFLLNFRGQSPRYVINYFGMGNETDQASGKGKEYYQVRQEEALVSGGVKYDYASGGYASISSFYRTVEIKDTEDRFITEDAITAQEYPKRFDRDHFAGLEGRMIYDSRNLDIAPTQGMQFATFLTYSNNLDDNQSVGKLESKISFYQIIDSRGKLVWATQLGVEHLVGNFLFYQSASIGGPEKLRGLRMHRFRGNTSFWNNNDFRYNFGPIRNILVPFDLGLMASIDNGRVWTKNGNSARYHITYGGGLFMVIMDLTTLNVSYHTGEESGQLLFGLNFDF